MHHGPEEEDVTRRADKAAPAAGDEAPGTRAGPSARVEEPAWQPVVVEEATEINGTSGFYNTG